MGSSQLQILIFPPTPNNHFLFWFEDTALPLAFHVSGATGGLGTSEQWTLFKFKKLHASVLKYLKCTEPEWEVTNYCSFKGNQIFFTLIPDLYLLLNLVAVSSWFSLSQQYSSSRREQLSLRAAPSPCRQCPVAGGNPSCHQFRLEARLRITHLLWSLLVCSCHN